MKLNKTELTALAAEIYDELKEKQKEELQPLRDRIKEIEDVAVEGHKDYKMVKKLEKTVDDLRKKYEVNESHWSDRINQLLGRIRQHVNDNLPIFVKDTRKMVQNSYVPSKERILRTLILEQAGEVGADLGDRVRTKLEKELDKTLHDNALSLVTGDGVDELNAFLKKLKKSK